MTVSAKVISPSAVRSARFETVAIDSSCTACGNCLITCPPQALRKAPKRPLVVDSLCTACGLCIEVCPVDAISERPWTEGRK